MYLQSPQTCGGGLAQVGCGSSSLSVVVLVRHCVCAAHNSVVVYVSRLVVLT
jgi:hypothetical protein